jgi:hypothetical protein
MPDPAGATLPEQLVVPTMDEQGVAVLMIDTRSRLITYASPPALALTGNRVALPCGPQEWSAAAGIGPPSGAQAWADPVQHVAGGGTVSGWRVAFHAPQSNGGTR